MGVAAGDPLKATTGPRLLFVSSDKFPPFRVDVRVLFAKELVARGYRMDWLLQSEVACEVDRRVPWGGGEAWVARTDLGTTRAARLRKHFHAIRNELRLFRLLARGDYDCIVVKDKFIAALFALLAGRLSGVPCCYWLSWPFPEESLLLAREGTARYPVFYRLRGHVFGFVLYRVILPLVSHAFVQSERMKHDVVARGITPEKLTPVPMGVDMDVIPFDPATAGGARRPGPPTLLYLGTLIKVRRLDFLIRALARVRRELPDARLVFVGDGDGPDDRQLLEAEAARCGVAPAVEFTGFLPMAQAWSHVAAADVCLSPFFPTPILDSTSPTKLIEYMAMGKAVLATEHPEQRLVVEASGAGLCVPWDEERFAAAAVQLLRDPAAAAEAGRRGRRYVEQARSYRAIAAEVDAVFRSQVIGRA